MSAAGMSGDPRVTVDTEAATARKAFAAMTPPDGCAEYVEAAILAATMTANEKWSARLEAAETALRFYADEATYEEGAEPHPSRFASGVIPIEADTGERARAALAADRA